MNRHAVLWGEWGRLTLPLSLVAGQIVRDPDGRPPPEGRTPSSSPALGIV